MSSHAQSVMNRFRSDEREASVRSKTKGSLARYQRSGNTLAGGVSSSLRRTARPYPLFYSHGEGSVVVDVDGNRYLDYTLAWGPNILGHPPHAAAEAVAAQTSRGLTYGAQHDLEYEVSELLVQHIPCADSVCFASSGTEIVQVALRLARAATGRKKFIKFEGHYHGWADSVLVSYHPGRETPMPPHSTPAPVGKGQTGDSPALIAQWNDRASVEALFAEYPDVISAVICEPLLANSGCIPPEEGFLEFLREVTLRHGALLIFDEVITGFRLGLGGAQTYFNVKPDLATYAKAVGAGLPLSVLAGSKQYMELISNGTVVHAGTLNGNPLALAAAKASILELAKDNGAAYQKLNRLGEKLRNGMDTMLKEQGIAAAISGVGSVFHLSFMDHPKRNYRDLLGADSKLFSDFHLALLDEGVLVLPDGRWYLSLAHSEADIDQTLDAIRKIISS